MTTRAALMRVLGGIALLAGCARGPAPLTSGVRVTGAWVRPTPPMVRVGAAYFTLESAEADTLLGAEPADTLTSNAQLHESVHAADGSIGMHQIAALALAAHRPVTLAPGGMHLMLNGLRRSLLAGDTVLVRLRFARAPAVIVRAQVREQD